MAFAALSVLLVALGVAHASEGCTDIDFFLSISAQEVSCAMLSSAGQCGCYVYAGEASSVCVPHSAAETGRAPHAAPDARPATGAPMPCSHAYQRR